MNKGRAVALLLLIAAGAALFWLLRPEPGAPPAPPEAPAMEPAPPTQTAPEPEKSAPEADESGKAAAPPPETAEPQTRTEPKGFCERDFDAVAAREADVAQLTAAGGVVHIFEREARLAAPYGCADFYLAHGLDVDAIDPRPDTNHLTGLHFAIKRNDPRMLRFLIDHGADLQKRAGENDVKPMGYAYYLAFNDTRIDRNRIIAILDKALTRPNAGDNQSR